MYNIFVDKMFLNILLFNTTVVQKYISFKPNIRCGYWNPNPLHNLYKVDTECLCYCHVYIFKI